MAVFEHLRTQERAVRLQPSKWMELMPEWGQSVLSLAEYHQLEEALESAFPDRFAGPLGRHELASQYIWAVLDGVVLRAADLHLEFELRPADLAAAVDEMLDLVLRDRDRAVAARVVSDITLDAPFSVGGVELRPVGNWGLTDAYRDIDGFMPGAGRLLDAEIGYRTGPSFTFATLITHTDAAVGDRMGEGYSAAKRLGLASEQLYLLSETNLAKILATMEQVKPWAMVLDSVQTVSHPQLASSPGSVGQVRIECLRNESEVADSIHD